MTIYEGMDMDTRNQIIEERCKDLGISATYSHDGIACYVPPLEDKIMYINECSDVMVRQAKIGTLMEMQGYPNGDDSWTEVW